MTINDAGETITPRRVHPDDVHMLHVQPDTWQALFEDIDALTPPTQAKTQIEWVELVAVYQESVLELRQVNGLLHDLSGRAAEEILDELVVEHEHKEQSAVTKPTLADRVVGLFRQRLAGGATGEQAQAILRDVRVRTERLRHRSTKCYMIDADIDPKPWTDVSKESLQNFYRDWASKGRNNAVDIEAKWFEDQQRLEIYIGRCLPFRYEIAFGPDGKEPKGLDPYAFDMLVVDFKAGIIHLACREAALAERYASWLSVILFDDPEAIVAGQVDLSVIKEGSRYLKRTLNDDRLTKLRLTSVRLDDGKSTTLITRNVDHGLMKQRPVIKEDVVTAASLRLTFEDSDGKHSTTMRVRHDGQVHLEDNFRYEDEAREYLTRLGIWRLPTEDEWSPLNPNRRLRERQVWERELTPAVVEKLVNIEVLVAVELNDDDRTRGVEYLEYKPLAQGRLLSAAMGLDTNEDEGVFEAAGAIFLGSTKCDRAMVAVVMPLCVPDSTQLEEWCSVAGVIGDEARLVLVGPAELAGLGNGRHVRIGIPNPAPGLIRDRLLRASGFAHRFPVTDTAADDDRLIYDQTTMQFWWQNPGRQFVLLEELQPKWAKVLLALARANGDGVERSAFANMKATVTAIRKYLRSKDLEGLPQDPLPSDKAVDGYRVAMRCHGR